MSEPQFPYAPPSSRNDPSANYSFAPPPFGPRAWTADRLALKRWTLIHLATWIGGAVLWILGLRMRISMLATLGPLLFVGSLIPYVVALVHAYRVQDKLHTAGLYKHGAWQIVVGGLFLNPFVLGFAIPASTFATVRRIDREIDQGIARLDRFVGLR